MKRFMSLLMVAVLLLAGCSQAKEPEVVNTVSADLRTYYELSDGTWRYDGQVYQYRLEITGRMSNADKDSTFVYLSSLDGITFDHA